MKRCPVCNRMLDDDMFYRNDRRCKECHCRDRRDRYNKTKKKPDGIFAKNGRYLIHQGNRTSIYWTGNMISDLKRYYPTTKNEELAELVGVSPRTLIRKARELGLVKDAGWQANMSRQNGFIGYHDWKSKQII